MEDLETKCRRELKPGSVVVACRFPFPTLVPRMTLGEGIDIVWRYDFTSNWAKQDTALPLPPPPEPVEKL